MIKQFLFNRKAKKHVRGYRTTEWKSNEGEQIPVILLDTSYKISEVELEVLRQGNKKLYIQYLKRDRTLKIKKKLDKVLNDTEIERANEIFGNIYFEESEGKLYIFTYINLNSVSGFDRIKNSIEIFKRKSLIIQGFVWG